MSFDRRYSIYYDVCRLHIPTYPHSVFVYTLELIVTDVYNIQKIDFTAENEVHVHESMKIITKKFRKWSMKF